MIRLEPTRPKDQARNERDANMTPPPATPPIPPAPVGAPVAQPHVVVTPPPAPVAAPGPDNKPLWVAVGVLSVLLVVVMGMLAWLLATR